MYMAGAQAFRPSAEPLRPLCARFHWVQPTHRRTTWTETAKAELQVPLSVEAATALESVLQQRLRLPAGHTVFAVRPLREPAAPAVPLLLLHGLADPAQEASLDVSVVVRPVAALRLPRPLDAADAEPIPLEALAVGDGAAAAALLRRLQRTGTLPPGGMCHPAFFRQCPMHPAGGSQGSGGACTLRSAASAAED